MESEKQASEETSSEENDQQEQVKDSTKRSYECTYCKRGFTNAQALGGHMNIHRKDRAKSKAKGHLTITSSSYSNKSDEDHNYMSSSRYVGPIISNESTKYSCPDLGSQRNYPIFFQPTVSDSGYPHANFYESVLLAPRSQSLSMNYQEILCSNLSLRTGPTRREDNEVGRDVRKEEDEVDLELRLGHHHDP